MKKRKIASLIALVLALLMCLGSVWAGAETATQENTAEDDGKLGHIGEGSDNGGIDISQAPTPNYSFDVKLLDADELPAPSEGDKEWTFMVYLCGSDLESPGRMCCASTDIAEMAHSGFDESKMNVVVYTGGTEKWGMEFIPSDQNSMWEVHDSAVGSIDAFSLTSMGMAETLAQFLTTAVERYPAKNYGLILWNHGGGPLFGVCFDDLFEGDGIVMQELTEALDNSPFKSRKLDVIGFDACLMGTLEVANAVSDYANYMIASEESEPGLGWNYAFLNDIGEDGSVEQVGKSVIDNYFGALEAYGMQGGNNTMSCMDLSKIANVEAACDAFFSDINERLNDETYVDFAKARDNSVAFGHTSQGKNSLDFDLTDLASFARSLEIGAGESQQNLVQAIDDMIVCNKSDDPNAAGLSLYHPFYSGSYYAYVSEDYAQMSPSSAYSEYVDRFASYLTRGSMTNWSGVSTLGNIADSMEGATRDFNTSFTIHLTEEQMRYLAEAELQVFEAGETDEDFALVSVIPEVVTGEDGMLSATYIHRALFIVDDEGNIQSAALPYLFFERGLYSVDAVLVGTDEAGEEIRQPVRLRYALKGEEGEEGDGELVLQQILTPDNLVPGQAAYTERNNIALSDFDTMEIVRETRRIPDAGDAEIIPGYDDWETASTEVFSMPLNAGWDLRMLHNQLSRDDLYVSFAIRDYQNMRYASSLIKLVGEVEDHEYRLYYNDTLITLKEVEPTYQDAGLMYTVRVTNHSGTDEVIARVTNVRLNGEPTDLSVDIYGIGPNDGILTDEEQGASLFIPAEVLQGLGTLTDIDYDIALLDAANGDAEVATIPVEADMNMDVTVFD